MATNINITQITPPRVPIIDDRTGAVSREWYRWFFNLYNITGGGLGITPVVNGGTGLGTIPTNGQLLIGNGTGYTLNTLAVGNGISVTNGLGTITLANTGVLSNLAGTGISVSSTTGNVTIANTGVLSWSGGTTGLTPATPTTGTVTLAGTLGIANGGTNGSSTPTAGAVPYGTGTAYGFTAAGTSGQVLTSAGAGVPTWSNISGIAVTSLSFGTTGLTPATATQGAITVAGTLAVANGGTGLTSTPANGALDIGNGTGFTRTTLTAGSGVSITNTAGSISISATGTGGTVTSVTGTSPVNVATGTTTPVISLASGYGDTQNPYASKTANFVLAAPNGSAGVPTFRALVAADVPGSALTKTDDTNVTLTLGGSPTTALLNAASLALGWSGQLAVGRGGTGLSAGTSGGIPYFSSTSAMTSSALLTQYGVVYGGGAGASPVATAAGTTGQILTATTGGAPTWAAPATSGTVTNVSALTLGTTGTDLSSTVANGTTTPVITLQVPTASAANRGALSAADWTTFNSKAPGVTFTTGYVPFGQGTTTLNQDASLFWDNTNKRLAVGNSAPATPLHVSALSSGAVVDIAYFQNTPNNVASSGVNIKLGATSVTTRYAFIQALITNGTNGHSLLFGTQNAGATPTEKMRIASTGGVSIGSTTDPGAGKILVANEGSSGAYTSINGAGTVKTILALASNTMAGDATRVRSGGGGVSLENSSGSVMVAAFESGGVSIGNTTDPGATNLSVSGTVRTQGYTVATLPAAGTAGRKTYVTNALAPAFGSAVVGGGAVVIPVFDNGTTWIVG